MKKLFLILLLWLWSNINAHSQTFNDGVLEYTVTDITNNYVSVKKYNNICPTGNFTIPVTVEEGGIVYTITGIADYLAFGFCNSLTSITIPDTITSIPESCFYQCENLTTVNLPDSITTISNQAFIWCESLVDITIPDTVTAIGIYAFAYCYNLNSINIPESVTNIQSGTFQFCGLTSINIPSSVTSIGGLAFSYCGLLTDFEVNWLTPLVINEDVFSATPIGNIELTVPAGKVSDYQGALVWQDFGNIIENTLGISKPDKEDIINIYPNPVKDVLNLNLNFGLELKQVNIYNSLGQNVYSSKSTSINTSYLNSGLYIIEVDTDQ